jgi:hypothetical protein
MSGWAWALVFLAVFAGLGSVMIVGLAQAAGRRRPEMPPLGEPTETVHPIRPDGETAIRKVPRQVHRRMVDAPGSRHGYPLVRPTRLGRRRPPGKARRWQ